MSLTLYVVVTYIDDIDSASTLERGECEMTTFREFPNVLVARAYRHEHGTGGWIFVAADNGRATLFPPEMPPSAIFRHRLVAGFTGELIGAA